MRIYDGKPLDHAELGDALLELNGSILTRMINATLGRTVLVTPDQIRERIYQQCPVYDESEAAHVCQLVIHNGVITQDETQVLHLEQALNPSTGMGGVYTLQVRHHDPKNSQL